jgi:carboxyl-terminal processing protease
MTDSGRTVFGGGGIAPDEGWQPVVLNAFQTVLSRRDAFFNFTAHYFGRRDATLPKNWAPDEDLLNQFHEWLLKKKYEFTEAEFTMNHEWIRSRLKLEMWLTAFGKEEADRLSVEQDPQVARGIESLTKAKALVESAKGVLARRAAPQTGRQTAVVR